MSSRKREEQSYPKAAWMIRDGLETRGQQETWRNTSGQGGEGEPANEEHAHKSSGQVCRQGNGQIPKKKETNNKRERKRHSGEGKRRAQRMWGVCHLEC